jgi:RES domain-containing protein
VTYVADPLGKSRRTMPATRFNVMGGTRVLYLSQKGTTAMIEAQAFGAPVQAVIAFPVRFNLQAVIDLTNPATCAALQITQTELARNHRTATLIAPTPTQELGEACAQSGIVDGIVFQSIADPPNLNLAVLELNLARLGGSVEVDPFVSTGAKHRLP